MAVADVFHALISKRCYKEAFTVQSAYDIIEASIGTQFDPIVANAFLSLKPEIEEYLGAKKRRHAKHPPLFYFSQIIQMNVPKSTL